MIAAIRPASAFAYAPGRFAPGTPETSPPAFGPTCGRVAREWQERRARQQPRQELGDRQKGILETRLTSVLQEASRWKGRCGASEGLSNTCSFRGVSHHVARPSQ